MIFAIGTPVNAHFRPWTYDWALKPDALMISAIDFLSSPRTYKKLKSKGIHDLLAWDGSIICDSGAFSALNRKSAVTIQLEDLYALYEEINKQDPNILKITLDFPDDRIIENYKKLYPLEIEPVVPFNKIELIDSISRITDDLDWLFIGRLVPLMRQGGDHISRLSLIFDVFREKLKERAFTHKVKLWALGVGAPSILPFIRSLVEGCDSSRWRVTGSNMILLPAGGERGVGNRTKWRGTHHRIDDQNERHLVIKILKDLDTLSGGFENIDHSLTYNQQPKLIKGSFEINLPSIGELITKIREHSDLVTVYELELLLRTSGNLRLIFNYWSALNFSSTD
ncbi:MAG: hypothetical protein EAX86_01615 [Candidatus Heimdallarchaeota archaeon]|nr:hypothetical protein [Candidatus Heimdallarchaeota archaeon]